MAEASVISKALLHGTGTALCTSYSGFMHDRNRALCACFSHSALQSDRRPLNSATPALRRPLSLFRSYPIQPATLIMLSFAQTARLSGSCAWLSLSKTTCPCPRANGLVLASPQVYVCSDLMAACPRWYGQGTRDFAFLCKPRCINFGCLSSAIRFASAAPRPTRCGAPQCQSSHPYSWLDHVTPR